MGGGVWPHELGWEGSCETAVSIVHGDNIPNKFRIFSERKAHLDEKTVLVDWLDKKLILHNSAPVDSKKKIPWDSI